MTVKPALKGSIGELLHGVSEELQRSDGHRDFALIMKSNSEEGKNVTKELDWHRKL